MNHNYTVVYKNDELCHHGVKGQKWGVINNDLTGRNNTRKPQANHSGYYSPNLATSHYAGDKISNKNSQSKKVINYDFSQSPSINSHGVEFPVKIPGGNGVIFSILGDDLKKNQEFRRLTIFNSPEGIFSGKRIWSIYDGRSNENSMYDTIQCST